MDSLLEELKQDKIAQLGGMLYFANLISQESIKPEAAHVCLLNPFYSGGKVLKIEVEEMY